MDQAETVTVGLTGRLCTLRQLSGAFRLPERTMESLCKRLGVAILVPPEHHKVQEGQPLDISKIEPPQPYINLFAFEFALYCVMVHNSHPTDLSLEDREVMIEEIKEVNGLLHGEARRIAIEYLRALPKAHSGKKRALGAKKHATRARRKR